MYSPRGKEFAHSLMETDLFSTMSSFPSSHSNLIPTLPSRAVKIPHPLIIVPLRFQNVDFLNLPAFCYKATI